MAIRVEHTPVEALAVLASTAGIAKQLTRQQAYEEARLAQEDAQKHQIEMLRLQRKTAFDLQKWQMKFEAQKWEKQNELQFQQNLTLEQLRGEHRIGLEQMRIEAEDQERQRKEKERQEKHRAIDKWELGTDAEKQAAHLRVDTGEAIPWPEEPEAPLTAEQAFMKGEMTGYQALGKEAVVGVEEEKPPAVITNIQEKAAYRQQLEAQARERIAAGEPEEQVIRWLVYNGISQDTAEDIVLSAEKPTAEPITATNPETDERVVSYDGGKTWRPL